MDSPFTVISSTLDSMLPDIGVRKMSRNEGKIKHFLGMLDRQPEITKTMEKTGSDAIQEGSKIERGFILCERRGRLIIYNMCVGDICKVALDPDDIDCKHIAMFHTHIGPCIPSDGDIMSSIHSSNPMEIIFGRQIWIEKITHMDRESEYIVRYHPSTKRRVDDFRKQHPERQLLVESNIIPADKLKYEIIIYDVYAIVDKMGELYERGIETYSHKSKMRYLFPHSQYNVTDYDIIEYIYGRNSFEYICLDNSYVISEQIFVS